MDQANGILGEWSYTPIIMLNIILMESRCWNMNAAQRNIKIWLQSANTKSGQISAKPKKEKFFCRIMGTRLAIAALRLENSSDCGLRIVDWGLSAGPCGRTVSAEARR